MSKEPPVKTLLAMMLGFALAAVGLDSVTGTLRMTYGQESLLKGFDFLIAVIGLFGIGEILLTMEEGLAFKGQKGRISLRDVLDTWKELPKYWATSLRACLIGCWMGITPGGATPASFMSYGTAKRISKQPENFGKGAIEGVIAPETAAHADAGNSGISHCGRFIGWPFNLGTSTRSLVVHRAKRFCVGFNCLHVLGQHCGLDRGLDHGALVGRHLKNTILDHCTRHCGDLRCGCLHGSQQLTGCCLDARLWPDGLCL
jgi:hypothetical protein